MARQQLQQLIFGTLMAITGLHGLAVEGYIQRLSFEPTLSGQVWHKHGKMNIDCRGWASHSSSDVTRETTDGVARFHTWHHAKQYAASSKICNHTALLQFTKKLARSLCPAHFFECHPQRRRATACTTEHMKLDLSLA